MGAGASILLGFDGGGTTEIGVQLLKRTWLNEL